ncbi:MAG: hypothetical protein HBSIN02_11210 [Bacteroidia bacterium]|nr:MAG: hypothetical protein HBSIN02_11210 [Bacteroidia bacterium]
MGLPRGWKNIFREPRYTVAAGKSEVRLVTLSFPPETEAGEYEVRYRVTDASDTTLSAEAKVAIVIVPFRKLNVQLVDAPRYVAGGERFELLFEVVNEGNVGGKIDVKTANSQGFPAVPDSSEITLGPRQHRGVRIRVSTPESLPGTTPTTIELTAVLRSDSTVRSRTSAVVDVIPGRLERGEEFHRYPLQIASRAAGEGERLGGQVEISGMGSLSEAGTDRLELFLRTTDIQSQSSLGLRDEYRVRYSTTFGEIRFGDWTYSLSPLTELSRYGFGGGGTAFFGSTTVGGFYNESRFYAPSQRQAGGFVRYEPLGGFAFGVQHLEKRDQRNAEVSSVRVQATLIKSTTVDLEYGVSNSAGVRDDALAGQFSARIPLGAFDARVVKAGGSYQGYYRDLSIGSLSLNLQPIRNFQTEAYFRSERRNLNNDSALSFVPYEQVVQIGAGYSNLIAVSYRQTLQEDLRPTPLYRRSEQIARLRLGHELAGVHLYSDLDFGVTRNDLLGGSFPFRRYALFSGFSPSASQTYTVSLEYAEEQNLYTSEHQQRTSVSVGTAIRLWARSSLQGNFYWSRLQTFTRQDFLLLDLTLLHEFPNTHQVSLRLRNNSFVPSIRTNDLAYVLQYAVPLAIPLQRKGGGGRLVGIMLDENDRPVVNAVVNIGNTAGMSDTRGEFAVPLPPGRHYLVLDRGSVGLDRITRQPMPLEVNVTEGREERVILNIVRGATISAEIRLNAFQEPGDSVVDAGPRQGILVEAVKGADLRRRVSDSRGRVEFAELTPGQWTVRLVGGDIPSFHEVHPEVVNIVVEPGERKDIRFDIVPRRRTIRIIHTEETPVVRVAPDPPDNNPCLITYDEKRNGYILQVSSWQTRSKAVERVRVAERVTGKKATIERATVPGLGVRYRVKVELFSSLTEAELACRTLYKLEMEPAHD